MSLSIKYLLTSKAKKALLISGVKPFLSYDRNYKGCRQEVDSVWVGNDVRGFNYPDDESELPALVDKYFKSTLGMPNSNEVIWFPVFVASSRSKMFSTEKFKNQDALNIYGFIYIEKELAVNKYGTNKTPDELNALVKDQFDQELLDYANSCNYDPYIMSLESYNGLYKVSANCFNVNDGIEKTAYELMEKISVLTKGMKTCYKVDLDIVYMKDASPKKISECITQWFLANFQTAPIITGVTYQEDIGVASLYIPIESLPDIEALTKSTKFNFLSAVQDSSGFHDADIYDAYSENKPYPEWERDEISVLLKSLFSSIPNMDVHYTTSFY